MYETNMLPRLASQVKQLSPVQQKLQHIPLLATFWRSSADQAAKPSIWTAESSNSSKEQQDAPSWRELMIKMSSSTIWLQGHIQQLVSDPSSLFRSRTATTASTSLLAAAAATAAAPAGTSLAFFKMSFGQNRHLRRESQGHYWLRQLGLADRNVTHLLMGTNAACYGLQLLWPEVTQMGARVDYLVAQGQVWRLLTAAFLHGNIVHLGVNTLALYNIGHAVEGALGSRTFLAVYLGSAIAGNIVGYNMGHGFLSSMGSSGALCGIFGGYLMYRWLHRHSWPMSGPEFTSVATTLGINLVLMSLFAGAIDTAAHTGGFLAGGALTYLLTARRY